MFNKFIIATILQIINLIVDVRFYISFFLNHDQLCQFFKSIYLNQHKNLKDYYHKIKHEIAVTR